MLTPPWPGPAQARHTPHTVRVCNGQRQTVKQQCAARRRRRPQLSTRCCMAGAAPMHSFDRCIHLTGAASAGALAPLCLHPCSHLALVDNTVTLASRMAQACVALGDPELGTSLCMRAHTHTQAHTHTTRKQLEHATRHRRHVYRRRGKKARTHTCPSLSSTASQAATKCSQFQRTLWSRCSTMQLSFNKTTPGTSPSQVSQNERNRKAGTRSVATWGPSPAHRSDWDPARTTTQHKHRQRQDSH